MPASQCVPFAWEEPKTEWSLDQFAQIRIRASLSAFSHRMLIKADMTLGFVSCSRCVALTRVLLGFFC